MAGTTVKIKQSAVLGKIPSAGSLVQGELALNTADRKLYSKDSSGSVFEIGAGSGGGVAGANEIITYEYAATAGQTTFTALYNIINDHVNVYYNGMKLVAVDYTATSGTDIVLTDPAFVDDLVTIEVIKALNLANGSDITEHEFLAIAAQTDFAIVGGYNKVTDNIEVFVNGIKLLASVDFIYTDGTNIVLTDPADLDDEVTVKHIKVIALANVVNSSGTSAIIPAGTTAERDASPEPGYLRWNTDLNSTEVYNGSTSTWDKVGFIDSEQIEDIVGAMVDANTETNIVVTYNDTTGKLNFGVTGLAISDTTGLQAALDSKLNLTGGTLTGSLGATGLNVAIPHTATNSYAYISSDENNSGVDPEILRLEELNDINGNPNWLSLNAHGLFAKGTLQLGRTGRQTKVRGKTLLFETTGTWDGTTGSKVEALTFDEMGAATFDNSITSGSITTTGNISVTGTVDGRDIAADGLVLDLAASVSYVDTSIADLVDSAPATLNTLNELALALGDDANHVTTMTNLIGTKLSLAGGTLTGNVKYNDNVKAQFGTGNDLQIFSDGDNTHIFASNTVGNLYITGSDLTLRASAASSKYFRGIASTGEAKLYHSDNPKLATTSTGVYVTGNLGISGTVDGRDLVTDGTKLDGIADSANNYSHPANHAISVITGLQTALDGKVDDAQVLTNVPSGAVFTDTQLSDADIGAMGYIKVDTNTQLSDADIGAMGYIKVDTNTQVTVNNTLTSTSATEALSAAQGKVLQDSKFNKTGGTVTGDITAVKFYGDGSNLTGVSSDNWYVDALAYDAGTSTLTIGRNGGLADLTTTITAGMEHFNQSANPTSPTLGDTWYDTTDGTIYKYINDGSSSVWVDISTAGAGDALPDQTPNAGKYLTTNGTDPAWDEMGIDNVTGLQTALDAKTTPGYVDTAISNLIGAAPAALDTLQELGDALGDDANYAATITSALAGKFDKTGGTVTGNVTANIFYGDGSNLTGISTDNFYADALTFSGGVLTVGRNGGLADLTVNLDGRYDQHYNQGTAPTSPTIGDGWYDTTDGTFYKYINDGTNNLWVDISTAGAGGQDIDWTEVLNKPSSFTPSVHTHVAADVTDLDSFVDTKIGAVIDAAPANLDTLNELAQALGDDANFASTVTTSLSGKVDDAQVLTDVPSGAVFTDTVYSLPAVLPAIDGSQLTGIESATKSASNPLVTTNGSIGDQWINTTTGEMFICTDATTDANVWKGQSGSIVQLDMTVNFETRLYTGNSSTNTINMTDITTGVDFVWFKGRNNSGAHNIIDTIRGDTSVLYIGPNAVSSESSFGLSASSFTLQGSHGGSWNDNGGTYVAWCASLPNDYTNNDGSLTATIKTNGWMSAIKYGGAAGTQTVGHGLDAEPQFILLKVYGYNHYHVAWHYEMATSSVYDRKMYLNTDDAVSGTGQGRITSTSATTFGIPAGSTAGGYSEANFTAYAHIAYAFTSVANKCKVGSYTGNSSTNIIDCGFDTEFVFLKPTSAAGGWRMFDATRGGDKSITANSSGPEYDDVQDYITITTTGFTCSSHSGVNASGVNYIFMAIAKQT